MKLFSKISIEEVFIGNKEGYKVGLTEDEIFMLNEAFSRRGTLADVEESSLFHISRYIAFKGLALKDTFYDLSLFKNSEFLFLLSWGKNFYSSAELSELYCLCCRLLCDYKNVEKTCINYLLSFNEASENCQWSLSHINTMTF